MHPAPTAVNLKSHGMVLIGQLGWLYWRFSPDLDIRVGTTDSGEGLHVDSVVVSSIEATEPLTRAALRDLPLGVLQAGPYWRPAPDEIRSAWMNKDAPDLRHHRCGAAKAEALLTTAAVHDTRDTSLAIDIPDSRRARRLLLHTSGARPLAVARGSSRAAAEVAEANDVPITTVYRWLEGRRRQDYALNAAAARQARKARQDGLWPDEPNPQPTLPLDEDQADKARRQP